MKKVLQAIALWLMLFVGIALVSPQSGHSTNDFDWWVSFGYPGWLWVTGDLQGDLQKMSIGDFPSFWERLRIGNWSVYFRNLFCALSVAAMPSILLTTWHFLHKRRWQYHLSTAIALMVVSGTLLGFNIELKDGHARWGWPIAAWGDPYLSEVLIADISVAIFILFFTFIAFEWRAVFGKPKELKSVAKTEISDGNPER